MKDYQGFLAEMATGLAVCHCNGKLLMHNRKLARILGSEDEAVLSRALGAIIKESGPRSESPFPETGGEYRSGDAVFNVRFHENGKHLYVYFDEKDAGNASMDEIRKIEELNGELKELFRTCTNDTIWITDGEGNTLMTGKKIGENLGVDGSELEGRNVRDLEREGYFYPSVTLKVMQSRKKEVLIQHTRCAGDMVCMGIPYFNEDGELINVVSYTRGISQQIKIGNLYAFAENIEKTDQDSSYLRKYITADDKMLSILELIKVVAVMDSTVLIGGETGSGKGVAASLIHQMSRRASGVFLQTNCGAISSDLIDAELFGYTAGTFTGALKTGKKGLIEAADGGTLFLDEIGELPPEQQMKLLDVLQDKTIRRIGGREKIPVDVRIIAATNRNLEEQVRQGKFRQDLFYRLNVVPFFIPPLRERKEDIPLLVRHFSRSMSEKYGTRKVFSHEAMGALQEYDWPGNIRELEHLVEKIYVILHKLVVEERDILELLPRIGLGGGQEAEGRVRVKKILPMRRALDAAEKKLLQFAADRFGTGEEMARVLGSSPSNISRKMKRHGVRIARRRDADA